MLIKEDPKKVAKIAKKKPKVPGFVEKIPKFWNLYLNITLCFAAQIHIKEEPISDVDKDDDLENEDDDVDEEIIYELTSEDGYRAVSSDVNKLWWQVLEAVKEARMLHGMPALPSSHHGKQKIRLNLIWFIIFSNNA